MAVDCDVCVSASSILFINASCGAWGSQNDGVGAEKEHSTSLYFYFQSSPSPVSSSTRSSSVAASCEHDHRSPSPTIRSPCACSTSDLGPPILDARSSRASADAYTGEQQLLPSPSSILPSTITTAPPPHRPFVSSGPLSPASSAGESSSDLAVLTSWDWSDTGTSSGEKGG
ncbi:hypothetical protein R3P38DRAFT_3228701 [Favolaschia claudopus]|uniref:Uncharacterized protein n=1 Tax=Favolaschia claudopus TaxID=2862362 RepID=A0AAV9ZQ87_9AGAR